VGPDDELVAIESELHGAVAVGPVRGDPSRAASVWGGMTIPVLRTGSSEKLRRLQHGADFAPAEGLGR